MILSKNFFLTQVFIFKNFYHIFLFNCRFIDLVDGKELIASVRNGDGEVVSLPPITNGEKTKVCFSFKKQFCKAGDIFIKGDHHNSKEARRRGGVTQLKSK